jgi:hypothetical protein
VLTASSIEVVDVPVSSAPRAHLQSHAEDDSLIAFSTASRVSPVRF